MAKSVTKTPTDNELMKAKAREQVASRKLDRLKDRYQKLKAITDTQFESHAEERTRLEQALADARAENEELRTRLQGVKDEAAMWKAQLFDQLDRAEARHEEFVALQTELAEAQWQMVELVNEERLRCETERARADLATEQARKQLVAERARVDGLKNLGACLTARLERATAQRKVLQREHARLAELAESRTAQLEARELELEELRAQLFQARGQLLSHRLESQSWDALKEGLGADSAASLAMDEELVSSDSQFEPTEAELTASGEWDLHISSETRPAGPPQRVGQRQVKLARPLPPEVNPPAFKPSELWGRASKTLGGWFRLKG
jgi:DNA repair exonuclease SbcCD ATPase subunit